jgi:putative phosphoribosyl transferase
VNNGIHSTLIRIPAANVYLEGCFDMPEGAERLVIFSHGSGSSRFSPRNNFVAGILQKKNIATLLVDLLTPEEDTNYARRFDIDLLTERLVSVTEWVLNEYYHDHFSIGYFGASTGAASALKAAALSGNEVKAVVSRGGRPDLAMRSLPLIKAPVLLVVGSRDTVVRELNEEAYARLRCKKAMKVIEGATHLFEEPGALEEVAVLAAGWFAENMKPAIALEEKIADRVFQRPI